ncbi:peptidoglycan-binding domain-containing protein [Alkalihalobacillus sp. CinArs1]|uniref:peptidoglycan-binding domain-containing protein n=1 Tax=Alkalihalobacillus sp. CinArs1 TaxID=2995314 RepID=UPI0022DD0E66|nr:peptidoglycan-binding protein [Alkalihalobacillus sp. CinArs1]
MTASYHLLDGSDVIDVIPTPPPKNVLLISYGDRGDEVKRIQNYLINAGMNLQEYGADGIFGRETELAVKKFQRLYGLSEDGIVGPITLAALKKAPKRPSSQAPVRPYPGHYVMIGDRGKDVEAIQRAVNVKPDGIFGPITRDAVRSYQSRKGLLVDGIVGPKTWNVMF